MKLYMLLLCPSATGNVINVVNSKNIRWGNDYYMGPAYMPQKHFKYGYESEPEEEEEIKKCNNIKLLLEAEIKVYYHHVNTNKQCIYRRSLPIA